VAHQAHPEARNQKMTGLPADDYERLMREARFDR
jgi:hypothetical protein